MYGLLNQAASHRTQTSVNVNAESVFANAVLICCRREDKAVRVTRANGSVIFSKALYYTIAPIHVHDTLDGSPVISVESITGLDGIARGYLSYV